jgi:exodeoxyribonuclease VII small subunit
MSKTRTPPAESSKTERELTFEEALKRLEEIVETLEKGNTPLEESMDLYEEGMKLGKSCMARMKLN